MVAPPLAPTAPERRLPLLNTLGKVIMIFGLSLLLPIGVSHYLDDGAQLAFDEALVVTVSIGALLWRASRRSQRELATRDGFLLVGLVWTVLPALATLPLLFYFPDMSFTEAYFETVSGLTATGASVMDQLDNLPASVNLWRTQLCWMGGMGIVVLAVAILPLLGVGGAQLFKAETPTPMKDNRLTPRINETAKGLWMVYFVATLLCVLAYRLAGMSWLDALMHGFSTISLGGLTPHDASFAYFDSLAIELICIAFMLFASLNFATHFLVWHRRSLRAYWRDPEVVWVLGVMLASVAVIALFLYWRQYYETFTEALRYAAFNVVAVASTAGFSTADYNQWPVFAPLWMLFLSAVACSSGSTGGGIKMIRALVLLNQAFRELTRIVHPRATVPLKIGGTTIENKLIFAVLAFMLIYGGTMIATTLALAASGVDTITAFSAIVACLNNLGPGLHQVGPASNFAGFNAFQLWICTATMLLGRLELFSLLVLFTPAFWRK